MTSFLLYEIRNVLRLEGYKVNKHTNRRVMCDLLELKKDSTLFNICEKLEISYIKREKHSHYNNPKEIFLHFLDKKTTINFNSFSDASRKLGVNLMNYQKEKILEKAIIVDGQKAVVSLSSVIDRDYNFSPCLENKVNINLALSQKLGYVVDYEISIPEIFDLLQEKIPSHRLKERLCQLLEIPYFFEKKNRDTRRRKVLARAQDDETLMFNSFNSAAKFFQINSGNISKMIDLNYKIPLWYKRYSLEFV